MQEAQNYTVRTTVGFFAHGLNSRSRGGAQAGDGEDGGGEHADEGPAHPGVPAGGLDLVEAAGTLAELDSLRRSARAADRPGEQPDRLRVARRVAAAGRAPSVLRRATGICWKTC